MTQLIQEVRWPGVTSVQTFSYTCNHGISPNTALITTYPEVSQPAKFGTLEFFDGITWLRIPGCRIRRQDGQQSEDGTSYQLWIDDPRWAWRSKFGGFGDVPGGDYNQRDNRGELVPWTVRSPEELAIMCLRAMGVTNWRLRLPPGLTSKVAAGMTRRLFLGERLPPTNTNPRFVWDHTPPAEALAQLADTFGCRVIFQPFSGLVIVAPPGEGRSLPPASYEMLAPTIEGTQVPSQIGLYCDALRVQARFKLEPLAKEYNGWPVPMDDVSYAPPLANAGPHIEEIKYNEPTPAPATVASLVLTVNYKDASNNDQTIVLSASDSTSTTIAQRWANLVDIYNGIPEAVALFTLNTGVATTTLTGKNNGQVLNVTVTSYEEPNPFTNSTIQQAKKGGFGWESCPPPDFYTVRPTDQLSYLEAINLAKESVWRWFRITLENPGSGKIKVKAPKRKWDFKKKQLTPVPPPKPAPKGLQLPWYSDQFGTPLRRSQILLLDTKADQVKPSPRIEGGQDANNPVPFTVATGILAESYTGRSRDQAATITGSIYSHIGRVIWGPNPQPAAGPGRSMNTLPTDRVFVGFRIVTEPNSGEQLVVFDEPVYVWNRASKTTAKYTKPNLILETSCYVKHPQYDNILRYETGLDIPGGEAPIEWHRHEDIKVAAVGKYDDENNLIGWDWAEGDIEYANAAAAYYLNGHASKYRLVAGLTVKYPYIINIEPDPAIQQVTWMMDSSGITTVASANNEHSPVIPDYPDRRRPELLPPNKLAADANMREREWVEKFTPQVGRPLGK